MSKLKVEQIKEIPSLAANGLNNLEIARHFGVHRQTIVYWISRLRHDGFHIPNRARGRKQLDLTK